LGIAALKALLLVVSGLLGGIAGALLTTQLGGSPEPARAAAPPRAAESAVTESVLRQLEQRLAAIEARLGDGPRRLPAGEEARAAATPEQPASGAGPSQPSPETEPEGTAAVAVATWLPPLLEGRFEGEVVGQLFSRLTAHPEQIAETIRSIEAAIREDPANAELRVALGTALVAKLQNDTPPGIQQGIVWGQADQAYAKAIELDPTHWTARYSRTFGTSFIPPQFGRQPEAIRQFEELVALQEQGAPEPEHAQSYFQLGRLYNESGNVEKAREVWRRGLALFPDDDQLNEMLEVSSKR